MGDYTTVNSVADYLNVTRFDETTTPTSSSVEERIDEAEAHIERVTGHAWRSTTITNEYHELNNIYTNYTGIPIHLDHRQIKTLDSDEGDSIAVWSGANWTNWLTESSRTEGRSKDYWMRYEDGILYLRNWTRYPVGVRVTYRYGDSTVPYDIKKAALLLVCIDLIGTDDRSVVLPDVGSSQLAYASKVEMWEKKVKEIINDHMEFRLPTR